MCPVSDDPSPWDPVRCRRSGKCSDPDRSADNPHFRCIYPSWRLPHPHGSVSPDAAYDTAPQPAVKRSSPLRYTASVLRSPLSPHRDHIDKSLFYPRSHFQTTRIHCRPTAPQYPCTTDPTEKNLYRFPEAASASWYRLRRSGRIRLHPPHRLCRLPAHWNKQSCNCPGKKEALPSFLPHCFHPAASATDRSRSPVHPSVPDTTYLPQHWPTYYPTDCHCLSGCRSPGCSPGFRPVPIQHPGKNKTVPLTFHPLSVSHTAAYHRTDSHPYP